MSVRPKMHPAEKFAWVAVLIAFTLLEVWAIDRTDKESKHARDLQDQEFSRIANGLAESIRSSQRQFEATMSSEKEIRARTMEAANLSKENLENLLGTNSYAWVTPQISSISEESAIPLSIHNFGDHALTGVSVHIIDMQAVDDVAFAGKEYDSNLDMNNIFKSPQIEVGTLPGGGSLFLSETLPPLNFTKTPKRSFRITVSSQSGLVDEFLQFRKSQNVKQPHMLAYTMSVSLDSTILANGKVRIGRELEFTGWSDEGFKGKRLFRGKQQ